MKLLFALAFLALLGGAFLWERGVSQRLQSENHSLRADQEEADRLAAENKELAAIPASSGEALGIAERSELLKLRNEVRLLRGQRGEADKLRAANQRAAAELKDGKFTPRRLADEPGAVPRDKWVHAGFATPEAAVQSVFAAFASGDPERVIACMTPQMAQKVRQQQAQNPDDFQRNFIEGTKQFGKASALRIVETKERPDGGMEVHVQFSINGEAMPMPLQRVGNEWKFGDL